MTGPDKHRLYEMACAADELLSDIAQATHDDLLTDESVNDRMSMLQIHVSAGSARKCVSHIKQTIKAA